MSSLIWLSSYPKSGNTWFRSFISNLISNSEEPVNINSMLTDGIASGRNIFDENTGIDSSDLSFEEIDNLRPEVYEYMAERAEKRLYIKIHDAYTYLEDGRPLIPNHKAKVIYILRNPLDVAVSLAFHLNSTYDDAIKKMGQEEFCFCSNDKKHHIQLRQRLLSWGSHVKSWVDNGNIPIEVIRYEDMVEKPFETFSKAVQFIGLDVSEEKIKKAIKFSSFDILKSQEEKENFKEKPTKAKSFFREGKSGNYNNHLSEVQIEQIIKDHSEIMKRFGYI